MYEAAARPRAAESCAGRVLLVDDEVALLRSYGRILRSAGYSVHELSDSRQVTSVIAANEFDAVVTDIWMSGLTGLDLLSATRQLDPDLPVVLMTGGRDLKSAVRAVDSGAHGFLLKPIAASVLADATRRAVRSRKLARTNRHAMRLYRRAIEQSLDRADLSARFDRALGELRMVYQPIVRWSRRSVFGFEALVRTDEPSRARPMDLIATAEDLGRLFDLGRVIRRQVARAVDSAGPGRMMFVNLHPLDLEDDELVSPDSPLSAVADRVVLEVTERVSTQQVCELDRRLDALRALGFRIAIDDLGAGHSNLTGFAQLRPDIVKLDMALTRGVAGNRTRTLLIASLMTLCRELELPVIAEGVETATDRDALAKLGCDLFQGDLIGGSSDRFEVPTCLSPWQSLEEAGGDGAAACTA